MIHHINLDDDTSELLQANAALSRLTVSDLIDRLLSERLPDLHELLALVRTFPQLREQAANLLVSFGPEPLATGVKQIAPPEYETLGERFEREMSEVMGEPRSAH